MDDEKKEEEESESTFPRAPMAAACLVTSSGHAEPTLVVPLSSLPLRLCRARTFNAFALRLFARWLIHFWD